MPAKDIEERVRKIIGKDPKNGEEQFAISQAQNEVYGINSELMNNLEQERNTSALLQKNNEALAQAAEIGVSGGGGLNPSTQEVLKKYGYQGRPEIKMNRPTGNPPTQGRPVIINNNYNTTNNVVANDGGDHGNSNKFKVWLSNIFNRQKNDFEVQQKEYRKREWSLTRSANKMMRRMERISKSFSESVNPQNMGRTIGSQLKVILLAIGTGLMIKYWKPIMDSVANIESGIKLFFGFDDVNQAARDGKGGKFINRIKEFLGYETKPGTDGYNKSVPGMIGQVLKEEFGILIETFKEWMEKRGAAVKAIKFPDLGLGNIEGDSLVKGIVSPLGKALSGISQYLGNILGALVGGESNIVKPLAQNITTSGKSSLAGKVSKEQIINSDAKRNFTLGSDYAEDGSIKNQTSSMVHATNAAAALVNDQSNKVHVAGTLNTLSSIEKNVQDNDIPISREFLTSLGVSDDTMNKLEKSGKMKKIPLKVVEADIEEGDINQIMGSGVSSTVKAGAVGGIMGKLAQFGYKWSGAELLLGEDLGKALPYVGAAEGALLNSAVRNKKKSGLMDGRKKILVPQSDPRTPIGDPVNMDFISKEGWEDIKRDLQAPDFSNDNIEAIQWLKNYLVQKKENKKDLSFDFDNDLLEETVNSKKRFKEIEDKYDKIKKEKYIHAYNFNNNVKTSWGEAIDGMEDFVKTVAEKFGYRTDKRKISDAEQNRRVNYIMDKLVNEVGLSPHQAAGLVGNLIYEAGGWLDENATNGDHIGIAQWGPTRQRDYEKLNPGKKLKDASFEEQVDFLMHEITKGGHKRAVKKLKETDNIFAASDTALGYYEFSAGFEGAKKALMNNGEHSLTLDGFNNSVKDRRTFSALAMNTYQSTQEAEEQFKNTPSDFSLDIDNDELRLAEDSALLKKIDLAKQIYEKDPSKGTKVGDYIYVDGIPILSSKDDITKYVINSYPEEEKKKLYKKWFGAKEKDGKLYLVSSEKGKMQGAELEIDLTKPLSMDLRKILKKDLADKSNYFKYDPVKGGKYSYIPVRGTIEDNVRQYVQDYVPKYKSGWSVTGEGPELNPVYESSMYNKLNFSKNEPENKENEGTDMTVLHSLEGLLTLQLQQGDQTNLYLSQLLQKPASISKNINVQGGKTSNPTSNSNGG